MSHLEQQLYSNHPRNLAALRNRFHGQLRGDDYDFIWPNGWHGLVSTACETISLLYPEARIWQIRNTDGRLHIHATAESGFFDVRDADPNVPSLDDLLRTEAKLLDRLDLFQVQSETLCQRCGSAGQRRMMVDWTVALCDHCVRPIQAARIAGQE